MVLRVSGSSRDGQVVRLRSAKCTIGSGRNCTLRLRAHGVAAMHCLVLRGPAATVVRRWSADTRLNQQFFSDAPLAPGDRLGVGPIELEVLEVGTPSASAKASEASREADWQSAQWQAAQEQAQRRFDQQREQLAAESAQLDAQRSALAAERASFESGQNAWAEQRVQLQTEQEALARQRIEIQTEQEALARQRTEIQTEQEALARQRTEIQTEQEALAQQQRQWQAQQQETQKHLDQQRGQLAAESAKLETQRNALAAERNALTQERIAFEDERRQWESQRREPSAAAGPPQDPSLPAAEVESSSPPPQELEFQPPSEKAPVDLADVFRRVGAKVEVPDDQPEREALPPRAVRPRNTENKPPVAKPSGEGEEESLDSYMSRLMQRVRSTGDGPEASSRTPPSSEPARGAAAPAAPPSQPECPLPASQRREPATVLPRAAAPEKHVNLSAMRELANLSAHTRHQPPRPPDPGQRDVLEADRRRGGLGRLRRPVLDVDAVSPLGVDVLCGAAGPRGGRLLGRTLRPADRPDDREQAGPRHMELVRRLIGPG